MQITRRPFPLERAAVLLLLLACFAQTAFAARHTSITLDAPLHITSGYACLVTGDYRLVEEHPPLLKMLQAAPLLLADPPLPDPRTVPGWADGDLIEVARHVAMPYRPIEPLVHAARVPTMLVGVLLGALVTRWATDTAGAIGGILALFLYTFDPNILAHSAVAATDLGAAAAIFAALYTFWRWLRPATGPRWQRMMGAAVVLGLGLTVKSTALLVLPVFGLLILVARPKGQPLGPYLAQAAVAGLIAFVVLWAVYRFEVGTVPGLPVPVPAASHLLPLFKLRTHMAEGHAAFLMGENYYHGVWPYFPIAFALKTPPLTLALLAISIIHGTRAIVGRRTDPIGLRTRLALTGLPVLYSAVSLTSGINIGYRHLLPILPFLFVGNVELLARLPHLWRRPTLRRVIPAAAVAGLALLAYAVVTLGLFPWHLAYFNAIAGGPDGGYRYLVDSNTDWGQTYKALAAYQDRRDLETIYLSTFTFMDPAAYDVAYTPIAPMTGAPDVLPSRFRPKPGVYAISSTQLQGVVVADSEMFDYFRNVEPVDKIGHVMFIYEIGPQPPADWTVQCANPAAPLPAETLTEGVGEEILRIVTTDCTQSWLVPPSNGWFVRPRSYEGWTAGLLSEARLAYEQTQPGYAPPFALYEWFKEAPPSAEQPAPVIAAPSAWPLTQVQEEGERLQPPIPVGADLVFLGLRLPETRATGHLREVTTLWRVTNPLAQPMSLMAHLTGNDGQVLAVGDGLGVPFHQLQPGDLILQRHTFDPHATTPPGPAWLQVGAYTQPDVTRLPILQSGVPNSDRLVIGPLEAAPSLDVTPYDKGERR